MTRAAELRAVRCSLGDVRDPRTALYIERSKVIASLDSLDS